MSLGFFWGRLELPEGILGEVWGAMGGSGPDFSLEKSNSNPPFPSGKPGNAQGGIWEGSKFLSPFPKEEWDRGGEGEVFWCQGNSIPVPVR